MHKITHKISETQTQNFLAHSSLSMQKCYKKGTALDLCITNLEN